MVFMTPWIAIALPAAKPKSITKSSVVLTDGDVFNMAPEGAN